MAKFLKEEYDVPNINPYSTKAGKYKITPQIMEKYFKFASTLNNDISYGLNYGSFIPMVLLGKNSQEMDLPPIDYPLTITNASNKDCIILDLRQYTNKGEIDPSIISYMDFDKVISRTSIDTVKLLLRMGKIMSSLYEEEWSSLQKIVPITYKSYVLYLTTVYNSIVMLPMPVKSAFEALASIYFYFLTNSENPINVDHDLVEAKLIRFGLINKLFFQSEQFKNLYIEYMVNIQNTLEERVRSFDTLETIVHKLIQDEFSGRFKYDILVEKTSNHWHGFGKKYTPLVALENIPLFMVMLEGVYNSNSFANGFFGGVLNKFKKVIDGNAFPGNTTKEYGKNINEIFKY